MAILHAWSLVLLAAVLGVGGSRKEQELDLNSSCERTPIPGTADLSLTCHLRTLNSEFERANLSGLSGDTVVGLRLECSDILFYQSSLPPAALAHLPRLQSLHVEHCKLTRLPPGLFAGLTALRNLTVRTHNTAWPALSLDIGPGLLGPLAHLERLDLSANNIWTLPRTIFCPATALEHLNVSLNRLQDVRDLGFRDGEPEACKIGLQVLDMSRNRLVLLPSGGLGRLGQLRELHLEQNEISNVGERGLSGLRGLRVLNLAHNKLPTLPELLFADTPELSEVHLQNNSLAQLPSGLFTGLSQLVLLDLSSNSLGSDWMDGNVNGTGALGGLIRLVLLNLGYNSLTRLTPHALTDLYSLQVLNLERNQLTVIEPNTFSALSNLHTLILTQNRLATLDATALNGLFVLSLLSLDANNLTSIHPAAFHNCSSLRDLNLNGNSLADIPLALQNLTLLKTVDLGENGIEELGSPPRLLGLPNLYGLRLTGNRIVNVSQGALTELPALKVLNLARNRIQSVEAGAFEANRNLQAVRLDANYMTDMANLFAQAPSLIWLNVSDNQLGWFDYALIPPQLQWLDLHKNAITELANFYARTDLRLQTLDVSFNRIERVGGANVPDSIEMLFLNDNLIHHIEPHTFFKKGNLSRVDLFANQVESLELSALRLAPLPADKPLPEFYIGGNPILCDCNMEWLQRINSLDHLRQHPKVMDLDSVYCKLVYHRDRYYVPLAEADPAQFLCSYKNHCFHLCHCCDFDACDCQMTCPDNCTCYHDDTWSANIADCAARGHTTVPARIPMDSTEVYLDGNHFEELPSHVFIARKNLQVLYLNSSGIQTIANNSFSGLKRLQVLHLENNLLTSLHGHEFEPLESLRELFLQGNRLRSIANGTFLPLRGLEVLKLDGNQLTRFSVSILSLNPYLVDIALNDNPWSCDCAFLAEAAPWVQSNVAKLMDAQGVNCIAAGKPLSLVYVNGTKCSEITALSGAVESDSATIPPYLPIAGIIISVAVVIMLLVVLCRKRLNLKCGKCPIDQCYAQTHVSEDREKLYDAYIAYSVKDEAWVSQVLASELTQNDAPLRLLLHYKEFGATSYISDTIVEAVESSKRTVIVLSKNFVQSEWARFEFKSALHAALRGKKNRLVAVTLGDLPTRDLDPDLRVALRSATILSANDKLFWAKLRCALPDPRISYTASLGMGRPAYSTNGTLGRSAAFHTQNSLRSSSVNSQCGGATTPLYVPPFPPPNRPPPPFPTPRRPPPPAPLMWGQ